MGNSPIEVLPLNLQKPIQPLPIDLVGTDGGLTFNKANYFTVIFYLLLTSMQTRQSTVLIQSKDLENNANIQNVLNKQMGSVKFAILPSGAKTATINQVQEENQNFAAIRDNMQNDLITARQVAEVQMTQATTNVNILEQDASEDSSWVKTLNTIFQVIDGMTQNL